MVSINTVIYLTAVKGTRQKNKNVENSTFGEGGVRTRAFSTYKKSGV